jgi:hypothetical protein
MEKNVAVVVYYEARNAQTGELVSGDVLNHTIQVTKDGSNFVASGGVAAELLLSDNLTGSGIYTYTALQAETSATAWELHMVSSTANVKLAKCGMYTQYLDHRLARVAAVINGSSQNIDTTVNSESVDYCDETGTPITRHEYNALDERTVTDLAP